MVKRFLPVVLLTVCLIATSTGVTAQVPPPPFRMVGYYASYSIYENYFVTDIRASNLTHLNYAYVAISESGQCVSSDPWTDTQYSYPGDTAYLAVRGNIRQLQLMRGNYPNLKILMTVGGWDYSEKFTDVAQSPESRNRFVRSCVGFMRQYLFDGIDIDWRYPVSGGATPGQPADRANFTLLMAEFRTQLDQASALDNKPYYLTMLGPAIPSLYENIALDLIHPYVDWINLMSFGFQGEWSNLASHHAPLYGSRHDPRGSYVQEYYNVNGAVHAYLDQGVPANKLVVGIGLYAQAWQNVKASDFFGLYQKADGVPSGTRPGGILYYRDMLPLLQNTSYLQFYDLETKVPWMYSEDERIAISYEDEQSVRNKAIYVRENQLGGLMIWQLNFDDNAHSLLETAYRALFLQ
jgi:chitinase